MYPYKIDIFIYLYCIDTTMKGTQVQIMHSPTLNTVLMVEGVLQNAREILKVSALKRMLPKQVMHSTLLQILDYLQKSGKILITTKGVVWIFRSPAELERLKRGGLEI
jgi:hypothetical protein